MSARAEIPVAEITLPAGSRWPAIAFGIGAVGLIGSVILAMGDPERFYHSWLVSFAFVLSLALGGMFFVLLQYLTRAGWSVVVRRVAENMMGALPWLVPLFLPVALGLHDLYHWSHAEAVAHDELLAHKSPWLNATGFYLRAALYLGSWALLAIWFRRASVAQDESGDPAITGRLQTRAAPAMVWFGVSLTLASVDWLMSLEPHWYSTMFGVYYFSGCVVGSLALLLAILVRLQADGLLTRTVTDEHFHDLSKLLFGFTCFWGYIAFSQFMLMWYGAIPEETIWYAHRWTHGWREVSIALAVGHFGVPFFLLLPRAVKRGRASILAVSIWLLAMHWLDLYWLVMPGFRPEEGFAPHLLDLTCLLAAGGFLLGVIGVLSRRDRLAPVGDPRLAESLSFENV